MVLMIGNGYHDIIRLDETSFHGKSAIYHKHECLADHQIKELLYWLSWITDWAESSIDRSKAEEMRDKR